MKREMILRIALGLTVCVIAWVGVTLFFFGSAHPCGILENRQRRYVETRELTAATEKLLFITRAGLDGRMEVYNALREAYDASGELDSNLQIEKALAKNHKNIWRMSPYECLRGAITWKRPPITPLPR